MTFDGPPHLGVKQVLILAKEVLLLIGKPSPLLSSPEREPLCPCRVGDPGFCLLQWNMVFSLELWGLFLQRLKMVSFLLENSLLRQVFGP